MGAAMMRRLLWDVLEVALTVCGAALGFVVFVLIIVACCAVVSAIWEPF